MSLPDVDVGTISFSMNKAIHLKRISKKTNWKGKYRVLSMIREHKNTLFGPISNKLSKDARIEKWKQIFAFASSLNVVPSSKDYTYVRDVFWQNCRKYAISKLENCKIGRTQCEITACDKVSLDIIGRGSEADVFKIQDVNSAKPETETNCSVSSTNIPPPRQIQDRKRVAAKEEPSFAVKKQRLVIKHLELLNHKAKLEIALMEKQLGCPPSVFTRDLCEGRVNATYPTDGSLEDKWHCQDEHNVQLHENEGMEDDEIYEQDNKISINLL